MSGRAEVRRWVGRPDSTAPRPPPQLHTHQESLKTCQSSWWPPARPAWGCLSVSPSSGAGAPGSGLAAAVAFLSKEASFHRLLTLPVCNTHYQNDRVFSLITHYFHAARSFLTNGKNNSKNILIYGTANSHCPAFHTELADVQTDGVNALSSYTRVSYVYMMGPPPGLFAYR